MTRWKPVSEEEIRRREKEEADRVLKQRHERNQEYTAHRMMRLLLDMRQSGNKEQAMWAAYKLGITGIDYYERRGDADKIVTRGFIFHAMGRFGRSMPDTDIFEPVNVADIDKLPLDAPVINGHTQSLYGEEVGKGEIIFYIPEETISLFNTEDPGMGSTLWGYCEAFLAEAQQQAEARRVETQSV